MIIMRFSYNPVMYLIKGERFIRRLYGIVRPPHIDRITEVDDILLVWSKPDGGIEFYNGEGVDCVGPCDPTLIQFSYTGED